MTKDCNTCVYKEGSCYPSTTIFDKDKTCKSYDPDYEGYIAELEKENAELKARVDNLFNSDCWASEQLTKAKEIIEKLSKSLFLAKGIVRDLIDDTVNFKESKERATYCYDQEKFDAYREAEQFLREIDIDNAIQKANKGLNLDKIAEEIEQDIKEQSNL